jgi:carbonic anhydrase
MKLLDTILEANQGFVQPGLLPPLPKNPKKQLAIFTCMDTRLVDFLEPAMGIRRGDAKVIKDQECGEHPRGRPSWRGDP